MTDNISDSLISQRNNMLEKLKLDYIELNFEVDAAKSFKIEQRIQWHEKEFIDIYNQLEEDSQQKAFDRLKEIWGNRRNHLREQIERLDPEFNQEYSLARRSQIKQQIESLQKEIKAFDHKIASYKIQLKIPEKSHNSSTDITGIVVVLLFSIVLYTIVNISNSQNSTSTQEKLLDLPRNNEQNDIISGMIPTTDSDPVEVAEAYYKALDVGVKSGDFSMAYALLSSRQRQNRSLEEEYSDTKAIKIENINHVSQSEAITSTVYVSVILTLSNDQQQRYQGNYLLIFENHRWYMDTPDIEEVK